VSLKSGSALCSLAVALLALAPAAHADILASDHFDIPSYTAGLLAGQTVGGTGFTGSWVQTPGLTGGLSIIDPGYVGRPVVTSANSGNTANFANGGFTIGSGQLFISYDFASDFQVSSSRMDVNSGGAQAAFLGNVGDGPFLNFTTSGTVGSAAQAETNISTAGAHHLVGVLDFSNNQIAMFVDPSATSFYYPNGVNNANATALWAAPVSGTFTSYGLVDNLSDQATFDNVVYSTDGPSVGVASTPEPGSVALLVGMVATGAGCLTRRRRKARKAA
jgi:hypothetical protein